MDKLKQWVALTVVGCLLLLAAGWFLLVSPKRAEAADLRAQTASQESSNESASAKLAVLKTQAKDLTTKQRDLAEVSAKIPDNPALPALIRAITTASTSAGVELFSITPGVPTAVEDPAAAAAAAEAAAAPAPEGSAAPAPVAPAAPAGGTLSSIPVEIKVVGDYFEIEQFISELERLPRALRVANLKLTTGVSPIDSNPGGSSATDGGSIIGTVNGLVFMASGRVPAAPVTVPTTTTAGPLAPPTVPAAN